MALLEDLDGLGGFNMVELGQISYTHPLIRAPLVLGKTRQKATYILTAKVRTSTYFGRTINFGDNFNK